MILDKPTRDQVIRLRESGWDVLAISERLGLKQPSEFRAVQDLCNSMSRRYQRGPEVHGPVKGGPNRANRVYG